jgi:deoxyhypusine synthase
MAQKSDFLQRTIEHIDITKHNVVPVVEAMGSMAFQARNLHRAATIVDKMIADKECATIMCLAGSLISAGLRKVIVDLMANNMIDVICSTGANIVDQDFFEALGFRHYMGTPFVNDKELQALHIDRIYDTYIDEDDLRECDYTVGKIADSLEPRVYSSREFIREMGRWLVENNKGEGSIVRTAFEKDIPIFVPAFSDCSAGFGLVFHQVQRPDNHLAIDSAKDFREFTQVKIASKDTGLFMIGGGVPKNFAQDIVVAAEVLGHEVDMHKYAVQLTVADERDGALSGSTLKEACSWGKVDITDEQMVYGEATITLPLIAGYAYHKGSWKTRTARRFNQVLDQAVTA